MSKSLIKSTSVVAGMTMISRVLGFVRDMIVAQIFGVSASVDAFNIAFKIPNFMRNLFAEGAFSQAFVPILAEYQKKQSLAEVRQFINHVGGLLGSILFLLSMAGILFAPYLIDFFAPGLDEARHFMSVTMLRITFPYILLISLTAFASAILNCYGVFAIPAFTPSLLNIVLIVSAWWLSPYLGIPIESQAYGVFIAGVVQLLFQLPFLSKLKLLPLPKISWRDSGVRRVLWLMVPALFGASVGQISLLINTIFVSYLKIGSVTWLYYSERLAYFALGVFGVALATVVLPHLSRKHAEQSPQQFMRALDWALRCNLIIGIPATIALVVCAVPIIATLFQHGKFTTFDVLMTQQSMVAYAVGLQAFMLVKVLATGFFAKQDIKTPVRIGVVIVLLNICLNAVLISPLAHAGLALATSLSSWANAGLLFWMLYRRGIYRIQSGWLLFIVRLCAANGIMLLVLWWQSGAYNLWLDASWQYRLSHLLLLIFLGILSYLGTLRILGMRWRDFRGTDRER